MTHDEPDNTQPEYDPLKVGELRPLKELAAEAGLSYHSLRTYARKGRLKAVKFGSQWATTRKAVEVYLASRYIRHEEDESKS